MRHKLRCVSGKQPLNITLEIFISVHFQQKDLQHHLGFEAYIYLKRKKGP